MKQEYLTVSSALMNNIKGPKTLHENSEIGISEASQIFSGNRFPTREELLEIEKNFGIPTELFMHLRQIDQANAAINDLGYKLEPSFEGGFFEVLKNVQ